MSLALLDTTNSFLYEAPNHTGSPERMLLLAVLERAILDYVGNDRKEAATAEEWIFGGIADFQSEVSRGEDSRLSDSENLDIVETDLSLDSGSPFSFEWVCRELDLNPHGVAQMIRAMPKRGSNRIAPWYFSKKGGSPERATNAH